MNSYKRISNQISNNIKFYRKQKGFTQNQLSELVNTTQSNISAYEKGKKCSIFLLFEIAQALDVPLEELIFAKHLAKDKENLYPISKLLNKTYYCYYLKDNKVVSLKIKFFNPIDSNHSRINIKLQKADDWLSGKATLDQNTALITVKDNNKNRYYVITFNYYHDSSSEEYIGGLSLLLTNNYAHRSPGVQICALSVKRLNNSETQVLRSDFLSCKEVFEEGNIIRIGNTLDKKYYHWLSSINKSV